MASGEPGVVRMLWCQVSVLLLTMMSVNADGRIKFCGTLHSA